MYCGADMPQPEAAPEPREIPANLDALIRAAMSGQGTEDLKAALLQSNGTSPAQTSRDNEPDEIVDLDSGSLQPLELAPEALYPVEELDPLQVEPTVEVPRIPDLADVLDAPPAPRVMRSALITTTEVTIDEGLALLDHGLQEATAAWRGEDVLACQESLHRLRTQISALISQLPEPSRLPPQPAGDRPKETVRLFEGQGSWSSAGHPYALVLDCPGIPARAPVLARALEIDGVTARMLAVSRYPRVALRSSDPEPLNRLRERYQVAIGLGAAVVPREALLDIDLPQVVLGPAGLQSFRICDAPLWLQPGHDPLVDVSVLRTPNVLVAVPGEVVTCHYLAAPQGRSRVRRKDSYQLSRESRIGVLDLHGPGIFLRVVEGATDFRGLPGYTPESNRRSFRGLVENIREWFPSIQRFGSRVCRPTENPNPAPDQPILSRLEVNAWPMWEEYTRQCRLLLEIA